MGDDASSIDAAFEGKALFSVRAAATPTNVWTTSTSTAASSKSERMALPRTSEDMESALRPKHTRLYRAEGYMPTSPKPWKEKDLYALTMERTGGIDVQLLANMVARYPAEIEIKLKEAAFIKYHNERTLVSMDNVMRLARDEPPPLSALLASCGQPVGSPLIKTNIQGTPRKDTKMEDVTAEWESRRAALDAVLQQQHNVDEDTEMTDAYDADEWASDVSGDDGYESHYGSYSYTGGGGGGDGDGDGDGDGWREGEFVEREGGWGGGARAGASESLVALPAVNVPLAPPSFLTGSQRDDALRRVSALDELLRQQQEEAGGGGSGS